MIGVLGFLGLMGLLIVAFGPGGANDKEAAALPAPAPAKSDAGQGQLYVVSKDLYLQLAIRRGSTVVGTIGPSMERQMTLADGDYEVEVVEGAPELRGFTSRLSLGRGDRKVVEVRLEGIFVRDFKPGLPPPGRPGGGPPPPHRGGPPHK